MCTINCKGKLLTFDQPLVMGIINATPDSFYRGDLLDGLEAMVELAGQMMIAGASILDIGGQSTRPGSKRISASAEIERVIPLMDAIHSTYPELILSIDTYHSEVALAAVKAGASIVNDISAGSMDPEMIACVASLKVPYICMHMKGTPASMQIDPTYEDLVKEVLDFFIGKIDQCKKAGILDIIIDPGFGFGKTVQENFDIVKRLQELKVINLPILLGVSRKSSIYKTLGIGPEDALNGTTVLHTLGLINGASILRVHDVKEAKQIIQLLPFLQ